MKRNEDRVPVVRRFFLEEKTGETFASLKDARGANVANPRIWRVWMVDAEIVGRYLVQAYGDQVCSVRDADAQIEKGQRRGRRKS